MRPPVRNPAFGAPGIEPRWTRSDKDAVESLSPDDMVLGQIVPFELIITVNGDTMPEDGSISIWVWVFSGAMVVLALGASIWWYVLR